MTIPSWLVSKPALYAGAALIVLSSVGVWFHAHDARIREAAVIDERVKVTAAAAATQDTVVKAWQDSLQHARKRTDTVFVAAKAASTAYAKERAVVDVSAPQPEGVPAGSVIVPIAYVRAADSVAAVIPVIEAALEQERSTASLRITAGDSSIAILRTEVAELRVAAELRKPGISGKLKTAGIGALIGAAIVEAVRHR